MHGVLPAHYPVHLHSVVLRHGENLCIKFISNAEVWNAWTLPTHHPIHLHSVVLRHRENLPSPFICEAKSTIINELC